MTEETTETATDEAPTAIEHVEVAEIGEVTDLGSLAELQSVAERALAEITDSGEVGDFVSADMELARVARLQYAVTLPGYRDWYWTVLVTRVDDAEPTVLECCMLPGDAALLAPAWVPWAERLAEFRATHDQHGNPLTPDDVEPDPAESHDAPTREHVRTMARTRVRRRRRRTTDGTVTADGAETEGREPHELRDSQENPAAASESGETSESATGDA